ncbi:MAG: DoxX family protein [Bacteroidetes bacterium]|nr:DoxX family protein [Bacteroidota bacterium]
MKVIPLIGRIFFSLLFLVAGLGHFSSQSVSYAASMGVPMASVLVPISGVMAVVGALSLITGYRAKWGAWIIIAFLVPVTFWMHAFWKVTDPMMMQMQMANFMKNMAMIGGALFIAYFGSGPYSIGTKLHRNKSKLVTQ